MTHTDTNHMTTSKRIQWRTQNLTKIRTYFIVTYRGAIWHKSFQFGKENLDLKLFQIQPSHLYSFSLLYICIENSVLLFIFSPRPSTARSADRYACVYFCTTRSIFLSVGKIGSWDRELWRADFSSILPTNQKIWKLLEMLYARDQ